MRRIVFLSFFTVVLSLAAISNPLAFNARIETVDGETLLVKDFSMEGKRHFYVDWRGGTSTLDWKDITSFEIMRVGQQYWIEVLLSNDKKDSFRVRQFSSFRGKSDFGQWSVPFEKVKKVILIRGQEEKRDEDISAEKEAPSPYPKSKSLDRITLRNGDILFGNVATEVVSIRTNYGTLSFKKEDLSRLSLGPSEKPHREKEFGTLYSKYGDKMTGTISATQIKITLVTGTNLTILREHIKEVEFYVMTEDEQKTAQEKSAEQIK
ncbi:MAG: hypothetical protein HXY46_05345 [Syntrophaceae bacterium]|nr:hypothetical protein [Syntrophaceae bacterium]